MTTGSAKTAVAQRAVATLLVFILSAVLMFLLMDRTIDIFDEGLVLTDVMRTLAGDTVHRDYYSPYGSGYYYTIAAAFRLTENHFIAARLVGISVMAAIVAATFSVTFSRTRILACLCCMGIVGAWLVASPKYLYPVFPCLLLSMVATALVLRSRIQREAWPLVLAGCCAGATALFRYDAGFFLLLANLAGLAILFAVERPVARSVQRFVRDAVLYGAGTAVVFAPFAIAFVARGALDAFVADIIDYPIHYYVAMRRLPFPPLLEVVRHPSLAGVYVPVAATVFVIARLALRKPRPDAPPEGRLAEPDFSFLVLFTALTVAFFYKGMVRVSPVHMMMSIVPATLLLAVLADRWWKPGASRIAAVAALAAAALPASAAAGRSLATDVADPGRTFLGQAAVGAAPDACLVSPATAGSLSAPDYAVVANYLRRFSAPEERIFVGLNRHDKIFVNPVGIYFLADRLPGTRWHQFDPGLQTRRDIQQQMIADLVRNQVRWIVRDASFEAVNEPNDSRFSSGVRDLDNYISARYRPVARSGPVEIWLSTASSAPSLAGLGVCMPQPIVKAMPSPG